MNCNCDKYDDMRLMRDYWRNEARELKFALNAVALIAFGLAVLGFGYMVRWW